jgi:cellulose synthase/poly-beta-1,6-N-acetylglucosamine synthase-like glycosyltransferase
MSTDVSVAEEPAPALSSGPLAAVRRIAVVPAFNEERNIGPLLAELAALDPDLEVVVVSDGSTDGTAEVASAAGAHVVSLPFNLGIGGAVQTGFRFAWEGGYELAVRLDGDGQHDPAAARDRGAVVAVTTDLAVSRGSSVRGYRRRPQPEASVWHGSCRSLPERLTTRPPETRRSTARRSVCSWPTCPRLPGGRGLVMAIPTLRVRRCP